MEPHHRIVGRGLRLTLSVWVRARQGAGQMADGRFWEAYPAVMEQNGIIAVDAETVSKPSLHQPSVTLSIGRFGSKRAMRWAGFVRAFGLLLVLGLAGAVSGCGSGVQAPPAGAGSPPTTKRERIKMLQKSLSERAAAAPGGGAIRKGKSGAKSGP